MKQCVDLSLKLIEWTKLTRKIANYLSEKNISEEWLRKLGNLFSIITLQSYQKSAADFLFKFNLKRILSKWLETMKIQEERKKHKS